MSDDVWQAYLRGTQDLIRRLKQHHNDTDPIIDDVRMLASRMQWGVTSMRRYGETPAYLAELRQVYFHLDQIAREELEVSFNEVANMSDDQLPSAKGTSGSNNTYNIHGGQIGNVGPNEGTINNYFVPVKDGLEELKRGRTALQQQDYATAKLLLEEAVGHIDVTHHRTEAAQTHFLLALACLGGKLPSQLVKSSFESVMRNLEVARQLQETQSYLEVLAALKRFLAKQGFPQAAQEAQDLQDKTYQMPRSALDLENRQLVSQTQVDLWVGYFIS